MGSTAVVIVTYGCPPGALRDCVAAVQADPEVAEIQIVDNSPEPILEQGSSPLVRVHRPGHNVGFGAGQNLGLRMTSAPHVLMLNPDAVMKPGALAAGLRELKGDAGLAAVQGVCRRPDGAPDRSQGREIGALHLVGRASGLKNLLRLARVREVAGAFALTRDHAQRVPEAPEDVEWLAATALLTRRTAVEPIGGFDDRYFLYGEDLDLCRRLRAAGWRLRALPVEWASHAGGGSFDDKRHRELEWWRGTLAFAATWWSRIGWWTALAAVVTRAITLTPWRPLQNLRAFLALARNASKHRPPRR